MTGALPIRPATPAGYSRFVFDDNHNDCIIVIGLDRPSPADQPWLATPYWIAPAGWFQSFFDAYPAGERPGQAVPWAWLRPPSDTATLRPFPGGLSNDAVAELARNTDPAGYTRPLDPVIADGHHVHVRCDTHRCGDLAVFTDPDGAPVAVRGDWLWVFTGAGHPEELPSPDGYRWAARPADHPPTLRQQPGGTRGPVGVFLNRSPVGGGSDDADRGGTHPRAAHREDPPVLALAAVIMPHLLPGQPAGDPMTEQPMPLACGVGEGKLEPSVETLAELDLEAFGDQREREANGG